MNATHAQGLIAAALEGEVQVTGGDGRYEVLVVSEAFEGLNRVKRQQRVYAVLNDAIADGSIHAVTIRALTPAEAGA